MAETARKVVGVSMLTRSVQFQRELEAGLESAARAAGFELRVEVAEYRAPEQAVHLSRFAERAKVNAVVVVPCSSSAVGLAIERVNHAGIPVVTVDIASDRGRVLSHVSSDNLAGGRLAGELMVDALAGKGKVLVATHPGVTSVADRVRGFKEVLARAPGVQLVGEIPAWSDPRRECANLLRPMLTRTSVNGVFCVNDEFALGAVAAVEAAGKQGKVVVVGYDGAEEARQEIRRGRIHADVVQHPAEMARLAVGALVEHFAGRPVPPTIAAEVSVLRAASA